MRIRKEKILENTIIFQNQLHLQKIITFAGDKTLAV